MNKIVAIHQPNFFPWLGYFDKLRRADTFIFLDDVQYQKTGGAWSNRVMLLINKEGRWLTAPIDRNFHGVRNVNELNFSCKEDWRGRAIKTLTLAYKGAPFFDETYSIIEPLIKYPHDNVAEYNIHTITTLTKLLGYSVESLVRSSSLSTNSSSTNRLIELIMCIDGTSYLCGGGAGGYQNDDSFKSVGINLLYQNFSHPTYPQFGGKSFVSGLSILDVMVNLGIAGVRELLENND